MAAFRNLVSIIAGYIGIQLAACFAQAGQQRGLASGFKGFMHIAGAMLGFALLGQLLGTGRLVLAIGVIAAALVAAYALALLLTPEDRPDGASERHSSLLSPVSFARAFSFDLRTHRAFFRLLVARFLFLLGI